MCMYFPLSLYRKYIGNAAPAVHFSQRAVRVSCVKRPCLAVVLVIIVIIVRRLKVKHIRPGAVNAGIAGIDGTVLI